MGTHTDTHRHTQTHTDTHRHTGTHRDTWGHTQTHTDTHRHTQTHTDTHRHIKAIRPTTSWTISLSILLPDELGRPFVPPTPPCSRMMTGLPSPRGLLLDFLSTTFQVCNS